MDANFYLRRALRSSTWEPVLRLFIYDSCVVYIRTHALAKPACSFVQGLVIIFHSFLWIYINYLCPVFGGDFTKISPRKWRLNDPFY